VIFVREFLLEYGSPFRYDWLSAHTAAPSTVALLAKQSGRTVDYESDFRAHRHEGGVRKSPFKVRVQLTA
jgi:hypothetical protein